VVAVALEKPELSPPLEDDGCGGQNGILEVPGQPPAVTKKARIEL
jgi:hypothetical protein